MNPLHKVVIIEGCRTPFLRSGTDYMDLLSYQLGGFAIKGLLKKTGIDPQLIDGVVLGNVIANVKTPNVAREAALVAGIPQKVPCRTVSQACISAFWLFHRAGSAQFLYRRGWSAASDIQTRHFPLSVASCTL